jgi:hypothetical protein
MRLPLCVVVLILLLAPATAQAHLHVWDVAFSAAEAAGSSLKGVRITIGLTQKIGPTPNPNRDFSWLFDITNVKGEDSNQHDIVQLSYLGGGRYTIPRLRHQYFNAAVHGVGGMVYKQTVADGKRYLAFNTGVAIELGDAKGWAGRIQADYSFLRGGTGFRQFSAGAVKRFEP